MKGIGQPPSEQLCCKLCAYALVYAQKFSSRQAHTSCGWLELDLNASYEALESSTLVL